MSTSLPPVPLAAKKAQESHQQRHINQHIQEPCQFWDRVGACRHGYQCVRAHNRPKNSKTVTFWKLFPNPVRTYFAKTKDGNDKHSEGEFIVMDTEIDEQKLDTEANRLYQDLFVELALKYGEISGLVICGNYNPHLGGNVLVKFRHQKSAIKCYNECNDRWYNEKPIFCELSPVSNLDDAICKDFSFRGGCERGDKCNLIHERKPEYDLRKKLQASQRAYFKDSEEL